MPKGKTKLPKWEIVLFGLLVLKPLVYIESLLDLGNRGAVF